jgi:hypothetical protein
LLPQDFYVLILPKKEDMPIPLAASLAAPPAASLATPLVASLAASLAAPLAAPLVENQESSESVSLIKEPPKRIIVSEDQQIIRERVNAAWKLYKEGG